MPPRLAMRRFCASVAARWPWAEIGEKSVAMAAVAGGLRVLNPSARLWVHSTVVVGPGPGLPVPTEPDCSVTEDRSLGSEALPSCVVDMGGSGSAAAPDISTVAP